MKFVLLFTIVLVVLCGLTSVMGAPEGDLPVRSDRLRRAKYIPPGCADGRPYGHGSYSGICRGGGNVWTCNQICPDTRIGAPIPVWF